MAVILAAVAVTASFPVFGASPRFARLGAFEGTVEVQLDAADGWRPALRNLPLPESTRIRTGPAAEVEIELDDSSVLRMAGDGLTELSDYIRLAGGQRITIISLDHGLAYFTGEPGAGNSVHLMVPGAQAAVKQGSRIRLQAREDSSEIAIFEGSAKLTMPSAEMDLHRGQSAQVTVPESTHFSLFREITPLEPDHWNEQLDKAEAEAPASRLDMDRAGKWIRAGDFGTVWQPAAEAGWAPFRQGRWVWLGAAGFTWVGAEPWGWTPYHQGRWLQHSDLGWVWVPDAQEKEFSPGEVFWARGTNLAVWGPLAPGEQWNGSGAPRQFAAFNVTGGTFVSGAREVVPAPAEELPKDLLKAFVFAAALPSPPLPLARLNATRQPLRSRVYSAVEVTPAVEPVTQAMPAPVDEPPAVAEVTPPAAPFPIAQGPEPEPIVSDLPPQGPIVPGIIVVRAREKAGSTGKGAGGKSSDRPGDKTAPAASSAAYAVPVVGNYVALTGAGTAAVAPLYQRWGQLFKPAQFSYSAVNGGEGLRELRQGKLDFVGWDMLPPENSSQNAHWTPIYFPSAVSAVVPVYNVPGVYDGLKLTSELLAAIYLGEIRYWNDPRIMAANPRANLPQTGIILVNRADASATTYTWTDYLSKVSPMWKARVGASRSPTWPVTGLTARGDDGVGVMVQRTLYSLGYVDFGWAVQNDKNNVQIAAVRNRAGEFILAQPDNISAAAAAAVVPGSSFEMNADFRVSLTDAAGKDVYPIAAFTYLVVPQTMNDARKRGAMADFLKWMLAEGQKETTNFALAPLPQSVVTREKRMISLIRGQ